MLELHQLALLILYYLCKLSYVVLCLLLIDFKLRFHINGFPLLLKESIVRLRKELLHLVKFMAHARILVLKIGEV